MPSESRDQDGRQSSRLAHANPLISLDKSVTKGAPSTAPEAAGAAPEGHGLPAVNLPRGGGAIRSIGEKFSVSAATGTASASIPLPASPGRSGFAPSLSLSYDSGGGNGPFGFGWSLSLPSVRRKTDLGLPQYYDAEESDVYQITGSEDLVPVLERREGGKWCRQKPKRRLVDGVEYDVFRYRPRIESAFSRIERWVAVLNQRTHWRSIARNNVTTTFGEDENSRVYDPDDPSHIFQWLASKSYDDKGNAIVFEYKAENSECVDVMAPYEAYRPPQNRTVMRYLKRAKYGNRVSRLVQKISPDSEWMFEIVFDYGDHEQKWPTPRETRPWPTRSDPFSHSRSGFEMRTYRLCRRVLMFHHFPNEVNMGNDTLVSSLDICYFENGLVESSCLSSASCASSFTKVSYLRQGDGYLQAAMPPVEMEYSEATVSHKTGYLHPSALEGIPIGMSESGYQFVDLDGEGVLGILASQGGSYFYKPNLGKGMFGPPVELPKAPSLYVGSAKPPQLMDLLGDGHIDMVHFDGITPGFYKRNMEDWEPFRTFDHLPNILWTDQNLTFVDLTGDGHADILITDDNIYTMYPSLLEDGFGPPSYWSPPLDEDHGPRLLLSDRVESLFLADMTGDGLSDLVRIRYHEVCYWPNLGYGRFGQKISMSNSPLLQNEDLFKQSRIRLADIDGSGTTDILYLNGTETKFYLNQSGNAWTDGFCITSFPGTSDDTNVQVVDLLAKGTSCLVWSSDLAPDFGTQVRYVDLMATGKPYLVVKTRNNLGSETRYTYTSSSQFYLADKACGEPWITKLPFPVQVVERTDTFDYISKNRFVTQYVYHQGYYDGIEKEFRGFGMVETWDTERAALISESSSDEWGHESSNWDIATTSPPVLTKSWFHTGAQVPSASLEELFEKFYWENETSRIRSSILPSSVRVGDDEFVSHELNPEELRESYRALKGSALHSEIYGFDGTKYATRPYTVNQGSFVVEMLQPQSLNQHAIFYTRPFETIQSGHDRQLYRVDDRMVPDPRTTHSFTLKTDIYGNVLQSVAMSYGRQYPDSSNLLEPKDHQAQKRSYSLFSENSMTNIVNLEDDWLLPLPVEARTYELYNFHDADDPSRTVSYSHIQSVLKTLATGKFDLPYESFNGPPREDQNPYRRLLQHSQNFYRRNDLTGPLKLGEVESKAFPYISLQLTVTPQQMEEVFVVDGKLSKEDVPDVLERLGAYVKGDDGNWWSRTPKSYFSPNLEDTPVQELEYGRQHFFHPCRLEDQFSTPEKPINSIVTYDKYDLLVQETCDALGNRVTVGERDMDPKKPLVRDGQDYRLLTPWLVMDPNRNLSAVASDVMGFVAGTAVLGKPEAPEGDSLNGFEPNLSEQAVEEYFQAPLEHLHSLLGTATSRVIYDYWAYFKTRGDPTPKPVWTSTLSRDTHVSQLAEGQKSRVTVGIAYSDGFSRPVQRKDQAEPAPLLQKTDTINGYDQRSNEKLEACNERWVGSGWVVYNNKGNPVRQFEPFFTATHHFESDARVGVSTISLYDALQRVVAMVMPDHTWTKAITNPWRTQTWDANDLVLVPDPKLDPDVGGYFERLPQEDYLPTWYSQRKDGQLGKEAQRAAKKAAVHAETPRTVFLDALGHSFVACEIIKTQRSEHSRPKVETARNSVILDVQGNQHAVYDSLGRLATTARYSYLGALMRQNGLENGQKWVINDVLGNGILFWDSRKQRLRLEYDEIRRSIGVHLSIDGGKEILVERSLYGETLADPQAFNGRTKVIEVRDQSGLTTNSLYDFKGNLLKTDYQLAKVYREYIDWAQEATLEERKYVQTISYDAKNRTTQTVLPDGTTTQYEYNARSLEESVESWLSGEETDTKAPLGTEHNEKNRVTITHIDYDAKGQRTRMDYGNGARTNYSYDSLTFRLIHLQTQRDSGPLLQNLSYSYDPIANITHIRDDAQQTIFFRNRRVEPSNDYTYDSVYRLVEANGREHLGQIDGQSSPGSIAPSASDSFNVRLDLPGDGNAMGTYTETYVYDKVGNIKAMKHRGSDPTHPGWTRTYAYNEASQLEAGEVSNRLGATTIGKITESYSYDAHGNMTAMPHLSSMQWDYKDQLRATSRQAVNNGGTPETTWYVYNAAGQRVRKVTERLGMAGQASPNPLKERIYMGNFEVYHKYSGDGSTVALERETVHITDSSKGNIALVETRTHGSEPGEAPARLVRFQFGNHLGSAVLELDDRAQILSYEEYFPYGSTSYQGVRSQTETPKRYRYTGKERDEENGLYYHGARYYAPWLGRWTSCDPSGMVDGSDLYVYARDNPSVLTDPDGRQSGPQWQEVIVNDDKKGRYYSLEGTDIYRRDTKRYTEAWHEGGGDQAVEFAPDKITVTTPEKIVADVKKLDRDEFYLKYKNQVTPRLMYQLIDLIPIRPLTLPPEDSWIYMGEGGGVGTLEDLELAGMRDKIENMQPPSALGSAYGFAATVLGADSQEIVRMMHVGDQVSALAQPLLAIGAMASTLKGSDKPPPPPPGPPPPSGPRLPILNPHFEPSITPEDAFQGLTENVFSKLDANRALISDYLSPGELQLSSYGPWAQRIVFGNALERAMAEGAAPSGLLIHTGGIRPFLLGGADFVGAPGTGLAGQNFQLTTVGQYMRGNHVANSPAGTNFGLYPGYKP